jgi:uncharacterized membrane protein
MTDIPKKEEGSSQDEASVEKKITVNASAETLYDYWRNLENLPKIMSGIKSVEEVSENRSHWIAEIAGNKLEWDAEIEHDEQGRKISWRSVGDSSVWHRGSVQFNEQGPDSTEIVVEIAGRPAGQAMPAVAKGTAGLMAGSQIESDLKRFKQQVESDKKAA